MIGIVGWPMIYRPCLDHTFLSSCFLLLIHKMYYNQLLSSFYVHFNIFKDGEWGYVNNERLIIHFNSKYIIIQSNYISVLGSKLCYTLQHNYKSALQLHVVSTIIIRLVQHSLKTCIMSQTQRHTTSTFYTYIFKAAKIHVFYT